MGLPLRWDLFEKTVHGVEIHKYSGKEKKFQVQWPVKKVMMTVFWDMKGAISIDFFEERVTVIPIVNFLDSKFLL